MPNYVDKNVLHKDLCEWKARVDMAAAQGERAPPLPQSVGEVILAMADGLAKRFNFRDYTYIDEMKGDGIMAAVKAMNKFDPHRLGKSGAVNPYGFINRTMWRAFVNRITSEKEKQATKVKLMLDPTDEAYSVEHDDEYDMNKTNLSDFFYGGK